MNNKKVFINVIVEIVDINTDDTIKCSGPWDFEGEEDNNETISKDIY